MANRPITPRRGGPIAVILPTGPFIRDYLIANGRAYPYEIWRALRDRRRSIGLYVGSYTSFRANYIRLLRKKGLIRVVGYGDPPKTKRGVTVTGAKRKTYYAIVKGKEKSRDWLHVQENKRKS
ncbi:MAG: hypothetical protein QXP58_07715 [Thermoprotei archaeon]